MFETFLYCLMGLWDDEDQGEVDWVNIVNINKNEALA